MFEKPCKFCRMYLDTAIKKIPDFEKACAALKMDPKQRATERELVSALMQIGEFGTIRLARRFPFVTDEAEFLMVARASLEFYWIVLDYSEDAHAKESAERLRAQQEAQEKEEREVQAEVQRRLALMARKNANT